MYYYADDMQATRMRLGHPHAHAFVNLLLSSTVFHDEATPSW